MCLQAKDSWETIFPCFVPREIDFVKKEEELKKTLDEKDKWYKEQLDSLQNRVRPQFGGEKCWYRIAQPVETQKWFCEVLLTDSCPGVQRNFSCGVSEGPRLSSRWEIKQPGPRHKRTICWLTTGYKVTTTTLRRTKNKAQHPLTYMLFFPHVEQDWSELVPDTERLDTSAHRAKGQLAQKAKRQPPSRNKLKENFAVTSSPSQVSQQQLKVIS